MFDYRRKDNLSLGFAELLQFVEEGIQLFRTGKDRFEQHGVITCNKVAAYDAALIADEWVESVFIHLMDFQVNESFNMEAEFFIIDYRVKAGNVLRVYKPLYAR